MEAQYFNIKNLNVDFHSVSGVIHALRGVDITLRKGETVALVGESGSGKSVTMKTVMGLLGSNRESTCCKRTPMAHTAYQR